MYLVLNNNSYGNHMVENRRQKRHANACRRRHDKKDIVGILQVIGKVSRGVGLPNSKKGSGLAGDRSVM